MTEQLISFTHLTLVLVLLLALYVVSTKRPQRSISFNPLKVNESQFPDKFHAFGDIHMAF